MKNLHAEYENKGLSLSDDKIMQQFTEEKQKYFEGLQEKLLDQKEVVSRKFGSDLTAAHRQLEDAYKKEKEATLDRLEKEQDPSTAEHQAKLKKALAEIDRGADQELENWKKQKEGELQLELDKKMRQAEADIRKKVAFSAHTFGAKNENGKSVAVGLGDQSGKNTADSVSGYDFLPDSVGTELGRYD